MGWLFWLTVAAAITAVAAITGIKPAGTRPVARTGLMAVARVVLLIFIVILVAIFLSTKAREGSSHGSLRSTQIFASRTAVVTAATRLASL